MPAPAPLTPTTPANDAAWDDLADAILRERQAYAAGQFDAGLAGPGDSPRMARLMLTPDDILPGMALWTSVAADMADQLGAHFEAGFGLDLHVLADAGYRTDVIDLMRDAAIDTLMARRTPDAAIEAHVAPRLGDALHDDLLTARRRKRAAMKEMANG